MSMSPEPEYTKSETYKLLKAFSGMLGINIYYKNQDFAYAYVDNTCDPNISMPINNEKFGDMSRILGHKIAHFLVDYIFNDKDMFNNINPQVRYLNKITCDQISNGLFLLVERIVEEAEANGEDLLDYIKQSLEKELKK